MKTDKYVKAIIETGCFETNFMESSCIEPCCVENNIYNELIIFRDKIYPGSVYRIKKLLLLCTCYQIDDNNNASEFFFIILDNRINNEMKTRNITPKILKLSKIIMNKINYKKIIDIL